LTILFGAYATYAPLIKDKNVKAIINASQNISFFRLDIVIDTFMYKYFNNYLLKKLASIPFAG